MSMSFQDCSFTDCTFNTFTPVILTQQDQEAVSALQDIFNRSHSEEGPTIAANLKKKKTRPSPYSRRKVKVERPQIRIANAVFKIFYPKGTSVRLKNENTKRFTILGVPNEEDQVKVIDTQGKIQMVNIADLKPILTKGQTVLFHDQYGHSLATFLGGDRGCYKATSNEFSGAPLQTMGHFGDTAMRVIPVTSESQIDKIRARGSRLDVSMSDGEETTGTIYDLR